MLKQCKLCNIGFDYDGRNHWSIKYCSKQCRDKVQQIRLNLLSQRYREQNPDKVSKWKHLSYMKKIGTYKERSKINQKNIRKLNKLKVLTFYSKAKFYCDCCKESNLKDNFTTDIIYSDPSNIYWGENCTICLDNPVEIIINKCEKMLLVKHEESTDL